MGEGLLTLGVDTSTEMRSVALLRGGRVLSASTTGLREGGSAGLLADVDRVLASASLGLKDVGLFAAAAGPGSFTGLRSGLATVKGLALTLGRPAVGVPTLHAVAYAARPASRVAALIPAGRGEVFAQLLGVSAEGVVTEIESPTHVPPARLLERVALLGGGVKWAGGGAFKFEEQIRQAAGAAGIEFVVAGGEVSAADDAWVLAPAAEALAEAVAALAHARLAGGAGVWDAGSLGAIYVRPSDAELKGQWHAQG
ncbi:MAG TPA: tRNA (adenosine(37)-N6)-threonylcarbamoyltransferase complex dimerization subunit type 1 TsaB [Pyrinomonadaceae bacterium]